MIRIKSDKIIANGKLFDGYVYVEEGKIIEVTAAEKQAQTCYDYTGKYLSAGFIDLHTHGAGGHPFINGTVEDVIEGSNFHLAHGTTTILPTISAGPFANMKKAVENIHLARKDERSKGNIYGAHLEGPYLSAAQCGAQCPAFITSPQKAEYESLIQEYGDSISRWTYAPENDENGEFCQYLTDNGIIASIGHSNAKYPDVKRAIDSGASLITHLYSCTSTITREYGFRSLGVIESAFLRDELYVEIIADGKHLPPDLIKMIVKIKGADKVALITDSLEIAGTDITEGEMSGTPFIVEDGVCKLKDRSAFAGSVATADRLIRVMVEECGFAVEEAAEMLTKVPAHILGINKGRIEEGCDADLVVFDEKITVTDVFVGGQKI
jgi:N-acetylglucosamine-6-phosphate deacetylase